MLKVKKQWKWVAVVATLAWLIASLSYYDMYNRLLKEGGDAWGYYIYLPSFFISKDLNKLAYITEKRKEFSPYSLHPSINHLGFGEVNIAENGNPVIKYTSGVAIMISPFFLTAHLIAHLTGWDQSGFSSIYWLSAYLGVICWVLLGAWFLWLTLKRYFPSALSFGVILVLLLGTNLYYFLVYNSPMSHAPLFALYSILLYHTDNLYRSPQFKSIFFIGLLSGLITMIRPVALISLCIPLLWQFTSLRERWQFIIGNSKLLPVAILGFFLGVLPQLLYWKYVSGDWIFYSYGEEGFNFKRPMILPGLLSFSNGWLIYTPVMWLTLPGMYWIFQKHRQLFYSIIVFGILHVYIIYSWHNWYYINSFGSRPMIEAYALLAFPLTASLTYLSKTWIKWMAGLFIIGTVLLNQFQTWQVSKGIMLSEGGNFPYYMAIFGKTRMDSRALISADTKEWQPHLSDVFFKDTLMTYAILQDTLHQDGPEGPNIFLDQNQSVQLKMILESDQIRPGDYLRISTIAKANNWNGDRWGMAAQNCYFYSGDSIYKARWNRINNKIGNPTWNLWGSSPDVWGEAWFFVKVPTQYQRGDAIHIWVENPRPVGIYVRQFHVELWNQCCKC